MISADTLVLLSDIDGLYTADPRRDPDGRASSPRSREITPEIEAMAGEAPPGYSSGGMVTKLAAARIAVGAGCRMAIADGRRCNPLTAHRRRRRAAPGSCRPPTPRTARKRWIAGALKPVGALDGRRRRGARRCAAGKSLLPAGVTAVEGDVRARRRGASCASRDGREVGARPVRLFGRRRRAGSCGHKSGEIEALLGYRGRDEMIHRDDLVLTQDMSAEAGQTETRSARRDARPIGAGRARARPRASVALASRRRRKSAALTRGGRGDARATRARSSPPTRATWRRPSRRADRAPCSTG